MRSIIPNLIVALKHLIKANQVNSIMFQTFLCVYFDLAMSKNISRADLWMLLFFCAQDQACEAMEVFNELMESEVSIIVPHIAEIVGFCLEVGAKLWL